MIIILVNGIVYFLEVPNGLIFTLMEEPGYMLSVATLLGLRWQEQRIKNENSRLPTTNYAHN
ncbi:hypothetical protein H6G41_33320 [Tolypothrix sp. FACHB-123]|uniref:hypothetical protein n=1 Tax=Tolypothrix sp. FACHB-123 TaxID=2692868 RepID=UPI0016899731|nr:hypothetical protein [Tolypothrix sp. FACHB-123]MBD2359404.1 hypothetical protein [Tolypothrix sp. FACHB-123]